jgi:hypothetical protein
MEQYSTGNPIANVNVDAMVAEANGLGNSQDESPKATKVQKTIADEILDLASVKKIKIDGVEMTPEEIRKSILRQQDYTKKTQALAEERKQLADYRKFDDNFDTDLAQVESDPSLWAEFQRLYPEKYQQRALKYLNTVSPKASTETTPVPPQFQKKVSELESRIQRYEELEANYELDKVFTEMKAKYPDAVEEMVLPVAERIAQQLNAPLTKEHWERAFKAVNDKMKSVYSARDAARREAIKAKAKLAKDGGRGGNNVEGKPVKETLKQALERAISETSGMKM